MDVEKPDCPQNYFDGMKMNKKQMSFIWLLVAGTFLEQIDLYKFAYIAPALKELWGISVAQVSSINAAFAVGAIVGGVLSAWFADKYGRHIGMTVALFVAGGGALITAFATNYTMLLVFRAICGFGIAAALVLEAPYLVEMVPGEHRSRWQGIIGVVAITGLPLSAFISRWILSFGLEYWRILAAIPGMAIIIGVIFWFRVPESPRWLVEHNRVEEGKKVFKEITGQDLHIDVTACKPQAKVSYVETVKVMCSKGYRKKTLFVLMITIVIANAGFMITQMLPTLLVSEGMDMSTSMFVQQLLTISMVIAPIYVIIFGDRGGRKIPYAISMCIAGCSIFAISRAGIENTTLLFGATLMAGWAMFTHQSFASVFGAELYPTRIRSMVFGITTVFNRGGTIVTQAILVPLLYGGLGFKGYMLVLAGVYLFMSLFILLVAPRTAGVSLEELNTEA